MQWPKLFNKFQKKEEFVSHEDVICKNCETHFNGHFCPECGQSVKEFDKPFSFVIYNFAGDFFSFDTRFFKTFFYLLFFPGKLTIDFFKGKRVRYAPPFRIFIFVSFILFFVLQIYSNRGLTKLLDSSINETATINMDSVSVNLADSIMTELKSSLETTGNNELLLNAGTEFLANSGNIRQTLNKLAVYFENKLAEETNVKKKARLKEYIRWCRSPEDGWAKILEYMSWAFFFLLPVFALILKLFYIRRKQNYVRHLIFSIHLHSFIFVDFFFIIILNMLFSKFPGIITFLLILVIPFYLILALRNFYGQKFGKILVKFLGISLLYNIVFWIAVGIVFTNALSLV